MRPAVVPPSARPVTRRIKAPPLRVAKRVAPRAAVDPASRAQRQAPGELPGSLDALRDTERRVADEIRLGAIEAGAARIALEHLRRARLVLRVAVKGPVRLADEPAVEVTRCWLCGDAIVADRVADPVDVFRHMASCSG